MIKQLQDSFGRRFSYVRLSLTDACNFRCQYCLPHGFKPNDPRAPLTLDEIARLAKGLVQLGVWKIRLTGGEPTLRRDFVDIVSLLAKTPGIKQLAATTNGYRLEHTAKAYYDAGLCALNVSVDSLDPAEFYRITGHNTLPKILKGIEVAETVGFAPLKINVVLLKETVEKGLSAFLAWIKDKNFSIRFIELMETADNREYFLANHVRAEYLKKLLLDQGWLPKAREPGDGPANEFIHPDYRGRIGVIAPYGTGFCESCNRLRITARGELRLCLFGKGYYPLREYLQRDDQTDELVAAIQNALGFKTAGHQLHERNFGDTPHLASVGG